LLGVLKSITGIKDLEIDPHLYGAGLHFHPVNIFFNFFVNSILIGQPDVFFFLQSGGRLEMHLDYSIHPLTCKERRVGHIMC
jgi:hypothetical protein